MPFAVHTAGLCTVHRSKEEGITAFTGTFFLVWKKYDFRSLVSGICSWGPMREVCVLLLEDLQRCADKRTVTTALGPGTLSFSMQSEARGSPGHWVWWWVCPPSLGVAGLLGACSFLMVFLRTGWSTVEAVGKVFLGRRAVSACQEKSLTHRSCFPDRREKWFWRQVPGERLKEAGPSDRAPHVL